MRHFERANPCTRCHPERYSAKDLGWKDALTLRPRSFASTLRMTGLLSCLLVASTVHGANRMRIENLCTPSESDIKDNQIVISPDNTRVAWWGGSGETIRVFENLFFSKDAQAAMFI